MTLESLVYQVKEVVESEDFWKAYLYRSVYD